MAFQPDKPKRWLALFDKTIHKLWELEPCDVAKERESWFNVPLLSLRCGYSVETAQKYVSSIRSENPPRLIFTIHIDPVFVSRADFHNDHADYPAQYYNNHLESDVESVLDGMIFHPRNHTHIDEYGLPHTGPPLLAPHEIRIGGGIENAFVFLFHLRYQFCLVSEATRNSERNRLVKLFTTAIKGKKTNVPADELFDY